MSKTNTLTSHMGESHCSRADKMSGWGRRFPLGRFSKKFYTKKRRMFLKNFRNYEKI